jgi:hypothetical protein
MSRIYAGAGSIDDYTIDLNAPDAVLLVGDFAYDHRGGLV